MINRTLSKIVMKKGGNIFDEINTIVSVDDEAGGPFLKIAQYGNDYQELRFDFDEWDMVDNAVREMIKEWDE